MLENFPYGDQFGLAVVMPVSGWSCLGVDVLPHRLSISVLRISNTPNGIECVMQSDQEEPHSNIK